MRLSRHLPCYDIFVRYSNHAGILTIAFKKPLGVCDYRRTSGHVIPSRELHVDCVLRFSLYFCAKQFFNVTSNQVKYCIFMMKWSNIWF